MAKMTKHYLPIHKERHDSTNTTDNNSIPPMNTLGGFFISIKPAFGLEWHIINLWASLQNPLSNRTGLKPQFSWDEINFMVHLTSLYPHLFFLQYNRFREMFKVTYIFYLKLSPGIDSIRDSFFVNSSVTIRMMVFYLQHWLQGVHHNCTMCEKL